MSVSTKRPAHGVIVERVARRVRELHAFLDLSPISTSTLEETCVLAGKIGRIQELLETFAEIEIPEEHRQEVFKEIHRLYRACPHPSLGILHKLKHPFEYFLFHETDYKG